MSFSYNESVVHYILFNMELTATATWEIGDNAIDDIDDGNFNDNDDHDLDAIDPTIYLSYLSNYSSITVIHLPLSLWYSHSYDVIPYRDAINLSIYHIWISIISIFHVYLCQYKDIPVWSVTVGRPEDRATKDCITLLAKIQKRYLVS